MNHFEEPSEHWSAVNPQRCCSHCNTAFRLDNYIESIKYYTYKERGSRLTKVQKAIMADIRNWATMQAENLPDDFIYVPTAYVFLPEPLYEPIARLTTLHFTRDQLKTTVGSWYYWDSHGEQLYAIITQSYQKHQSSNQSTPSQAGTQSTMPPATSSSQYESQHVTRGQSEFTELSMLPPSTPSQNDSLLTLYDTPSQALYTPLPELSASSQTTQMDIDPPTPRTPMPLQTGVKRRQPLQEIPRNIRIPRPRLSKERHSFFNRINRG
jgi:hypothetical protein